MLTFIFSVFTERPDFMFANLTLMASEVERIVSLELFDSMLESVTCGERTTLEFKSKQSFDYAIKSWGWVNENETHSFILITDSATCAEKKTRQPYLIYDVDYEEDKHIAHLRGAKKNWTEVVHDMDLSTGTARPNPKSAKRGIGDFFSDLFDIDLDKSFGLDVGSDFSRTIVDEKKSDFPVGVKCVKCGTRGKLNNAFTFQMRGSSLSSVMFGVSPNDVGGDTDLQFDIRPTSGPFAANWAHSFGRVPLPGPRIPRLGGILEFGPFIDIFFIASMSDFESDVTVNLGTGIGLSNAAVASADLTNSKDHKMSGWGTKPKWKPPKFSSNNAKGVISAAVGWEIGLKIGIFGLSFETGLYFRFPDAALTLDSTDGPNTPCGKEKKNGTSIGLQAGYSIQIMAGSSSRTGAILSAPVKAEPLFGKRDLDRRKDPKLSDLLENEKHAHAGPIGFVVNLPLIVCLLQPSQKFVGVA